MTTVPSYLKSVFSDNQWRRIRERIYYAEIDGKKIGIVVATQSPGRDFILNCNEYERVRKAKLTGKFDVAFVVAARLNGFDKPPEYVCGNFLEAVSLTTCRKVVGRLGDFWPLQLGDIDPDQPL